MYGKHETKHHIVCSMLDVGFFGCATGNLIRQSSLSFAFLQIGPLASSILRILSSLRIYFHIRCSVLCLILTFKGKWHLPLDIWQCIVKFQILTLCIYNWICKYVCAYSYFIVIYACNAQSESFFQSFILIYM